MSRRRLILSALALTDLEDIWLYGVQTWGRDRADLYEQLIQDAMNNLASFPHLGTRISEADEFARSRHVGVHAIFYQNRDRDVEILRILSQRIDPPRVGS